jgi:hypothetical protein
MRPLSFALLTLALMALLNGAPSWAGAGSGQFGVRITLSQGSGPVGLGAPVATTSSFSRLLPPSGLCLSRTLSESTGASVEVACQSAQFVSIAPQPGASFLAVHGGAFRYSITFRTELSMWDATKTRDDDVAGLGWGTVTALRLYDLTAPEVSDPGWELPLDMLVSF